ncbi:MAG: NADH-quinone oxidoreductase subunit NuoH [Acidobacteriota bacterium]|jgi:NADH-quinone oxidoreductase subunit H
MSDYWISVLLIPTMKIAVALGVIALVVAYMTLAERKVLGFIQARLAPRRVGPHGILQPIADGLKLFIKEDIVPDQADRLAFLLAPVVAIIPAFAAFAVIPVAGHVAEIAGFEVAPWITDVNIGVLYVLSITSLGIYGIILGGWASNSKYSLLGALRSSAQMISYEVPLGFSIIGVLMLAGTASLPGIVRWQEQQGWWIFFLQPVGFFLFLVSSYAETNRLPFDLPEAESELVAGFHTEYSGMKFSFFFIAEYANMVLVCCVAVTLFFGGWLPPFPGLGNGILNLGLDRIHPIVAGVFWFATKVFFFLFLYIWLRGTFPRYRYDQLMDLGWKWLIPLAIANVLVTGVLVLVFGMGGPA